ncbi:MAG TPA: STAS domain-containing protein [Terracidiphilus sp.]|jgi:anti-anti-sigma regulatory factor|nr:STAS domain-containing protein [Terracidiphilus sp.]
MALQLRTVTVKQLSQTENEEQEWVFLQELTCGLQIDRPRIVLNCNGIRTLGESSLHLLLCCLEEAMKRNGDVRLSSVPVPVRAVMEAHGVDRLFKMFENDADAVKSFQRLPIFAIPQSLTEPLTLPVKEASTELAVEPEEDAA